MKPDKIIYSTSPTKVSSYILQYKDGAQCKWCSDKGWFSWYAPERESNRHGIEFCYCGQTINVGKFLIEYRKIREKNGQPA